MLPRLDGRQLSTLHPIQDHNPLLLFPVQCDCLRGDIFTEQLRDVTITDIPQAAQPALDKPERMYYNISEGRIPRSVPFVLAEPANAPRKERSHAPDNRAPNLYSIPLTRSTPQVSQSLRYEFDSLRRFTTGFFLTISRIGCTSLRDKLKSRPQDCKLTREFQH